MTFVQSEKHRFYDVFIPMSAKRIFIEKQKFQVLSSRV